ncbi:zinc finger, CCHC-type containing protein, partial [Tanacetum coccineum]
MSQHAGAGGDASVFYPHDRTKCPICLEKIRTGDDLKELPCKHAFHTDCIAPWFQSSNTCPYCRGKLPVADGSSGSRGTPPSRSADGSRGIYSYRYLGWRYGVYTQKSLNTLTQIVVKGILVADELQIPSESNPSEEVSSAG